MARTASLASALGRVEKLNYQDIRGTDIAVLLKAGIPQAECEYFLYPPSVFFHVFGQNVVPDAPFNGCLDGTVSEPALGFELPGLCNEAAVACYRLRALKKLVIKGKEIFSGKYSVWHDQPFEYRLKVEAGEEISIETEWMPHR